MKEQEYLEMCNHFKEELEKKESVIKLFVGQNLELKKLLMMSYTYARQIDEFCSVLLGDQSNEITQHAESLRGLMSEVLDKYIFSDTHILITNNNDND